MKIKFKEEVFLNYNLVKENICLNERSGQNLMKSILIKTYSLSLKMSSNRINVMTFTRI